MRGSIAAAVGLSGVLVAATPHDAAVWQPAAGRQIIASVSSLDRGYTDIGALVELRGWNAQVEDWRQAGELTRVAIEGDAFVPGRVHERFQQTHRGVPVWSGDVRRQLNTFGQAESIFGTFYPGADIDVVPGIPANRAAELLNVAGHGTPGPAVPTDLTILPTADAFRLAWTARVVSLDDGVMRRIFVDAASGAVLLAYDDTWRQGALVPLEGQVIDERGQAGDMLRVLAGLQRPGATEGPLDRTEGRLPRAAAQTALDETARQMAARFHWPANAASGNAVRLFINPDDGPGGSSPAAGLAAFDVSGAYYGGGDIVLGRRASTLRGDELLALVAHEVAHAIVERTTGLIYLDDSGALNEGFAEIMALAVQPDAAARYLTLSRGVPAESLASPVSPDDNGGVHRRADRLARVVAAAVTGAAERIAGLDANREAAQRVETLVFRTITRLLPANATFKMARAALNQSAVDLYGGTGPIARAVAEAARGLDL